jgi:UDP-hydrolysing UDP-N-acetyl-D-glucosamine 2-epimerase
MGAFGVNKRKVCIVITTRGNFAKMKSVMRYIVACPELELQLAVGGSAILERYGTMFGAINGAGFDIDHTVHFVVEGENPITMAKSAGMAVVELSTVFENLRPDVVVVIADRFEALSIAISASYMNIPLAHIEGGEVSGSIDESVRHAITKLSHLHFPATHKAAERIERLGEARKTIFPVGCTSFDVFEELDLKDLKSIMELQHRSGVGSVLDVREPYLLVIQHPVTTEYESNFRNVNETIEAIDSLHMNAFWIWPNMDAGSDWVSKAIRVFREQRNPDDYVHLFKSLPIEYFAPLLNNAACIVGNSSAGIREASFLGVPCVNVGTRQAGRERGRNVVDVGYDRDEIEKAICQQLDHGHYKPDYIYGNGNAGAKIAAILKDFKFDLQKQITY